MKNQIMPLIPVLVGSPEGYLCEAYCLGKSWLFRMFFGWRMSKDKGPNGQWAYYRIPRRDWEEIQKLAEEINY